MIAGYTYLDMYMYDRYVNRIYTEAAHLITLVRKEIVE